jgi:7-carboxy-7-deazaguanine synthase
LNTQLPVNEIFATLQGEGSFSGKPSIFIRFQGCDVGCTWCDTKHSWSLNSNAKVAIDTILQKQDSDDNYCLITPNEIIAYFQTNFTQIKHVVLTGGEPAMYNLEPLCLALEKLDKQVQIETSGTSPLQISPKTWVVLSPKFNMPGKKSIIIDNLPLVNEIKMPVGKPQDMNNLHNFIKQYGQLLKNVEIYLQPLSNAPSAIKLCISEAIKNNYRLSLQLHKIINIR